MRPGGRVCLDEERDGVLQALRREDARRKAIVPQTSQMGVPRLRRRPHAVAAAREGEGRERRVASIEKATQWPAPFLGPFGISETFG